MDQKRRIIATGLFINTDPVVPDGYTGTGVSCAIGIAGVDRENCIPLSLISCNTGSGLIIDLMG